MLEMGLLVSLGRHEQLIWETSTFRLRGSKKNLKVVVLFPTFYVLVLHDGICFSALNLKKNAVGIPNDTFFIFSQCFKAVESMPVKFFHTLVLSSDVL